jgi:hypothetical protein
MEKIHFMNKTLLLVSLMVMGTCPVFSQQSSLTKQKTSHVVLMADGGYSMPFGKYSSVDNNEDLAGYASGGFYFQAGAFWMGKRSLGLGLTYVFQQNGMQSEADSAPLNANTYFVGDKPWNNNYLLAGPVYINSFGKLTIMAGLNFGFIISLSDNFDIVLPRYDSLSVEQVSEGPGTGFGFQAKAGIGYQLSNRIGLKLDLSYLGGSPSRTKTYYYYYYVLDPVLGLVPVYQGSEFQVKKKVNTFNVGLGITIKI